MMFRLGFPVRIVGRPALRMHASRPAETIHLSRNLIALRDVLLYLQQIDVHFYRLAFPLLPAEAPYAPIAECAAELAEIAAHLATHTTRLTFHLDHSTTLSTPDEALAMRNLAVIEAHAALLAALDGLAGKRTYGAIVIHIGGKAGNQWRATLKRFASRYRTLSTQARNRLVVENDTNGFSLGRLLWLHRLCRIPIVFDVLHWHLANPERLPLSVALGLALATWTAGIAPKVHLSTARSEAHVLPPRQGQSGRVLAPRPGQHADFVAISDLLGLLDAATGLPAFDIMLEAKAGDLALLRLRQEIARLAPERAARLA